MLKCTVTSASGGALVRRFATVPCPAPSPGGAPPPPPPPPPTPPSPRGPLCNVSCIEGGPVDSAFWAGRPGPGDLSFRVRPQLGELLVLTGHGAVRDNARLAWHPARSGCLERFVHRWPGGRRHGCRAVNGATCSVGGRLCRGYGVGMSGPPATPERTIGPVSAPGTGRATGQLTGCSGNACHVRSLHCVWLCMSISVRHT